MAPSAGSPASRLPLRILAICAAALVYLLAPAAARAQSDPCAPGGNPIVCENSKPGTDPSLWETHGAGDPQIQGFATQMSVNVGQTISFKINTASPAYHIDILRLGYYQGLGARMIQAGLQPSAQLPQQQPACLNDPNTGLIDCGNWGVSASWTVPSDAVSGVYIAHLVTDDGNGYDSEIPFVVRNDASHSDMLMSTSDETWEAYNTYGGNSLYSCSVNCPPGNPKGYKAAYAVSYNRPWDGALKANGGLSYLYYAEYPMIRWLEKNGYDVSYTSQDQEAQNLAPLLQHKVLVAVGHDEYWSADQRANVTAARDAGVSLAFFTGNEIFWKTRWAPSMDGSNTPYRTLISYKETHFDSQVDPAGPSIWTGTWADSRFSPPGDGGNPPNALTGQFFTVNQGTSDIQVPSTYAKLRFWRNTAVSQLQSGQSLTLSPGTGLLGYEWDEDLDNGFRPAGLFDMSSTTVTNVQRFIDYGTQVEWGHTATHNLTLYRAASGALVFGAGTVQWPWGLDNFNGWHVATFDPTGNPPDPTVEQATVNLFADMGVQPQSLQSDLVQTQQSTDTTPPTTTIASPTPGTSVANGSTVNVTGTATDAGGGVVSGIEVSGDNGRTWHPAQITGADDATVNWTYSWVPRTTPSTVLLVRAIDDSGNIEAAHGMTLPVTCPCSIFGNLTPRYADAGDPTALTLGVKFTADQFGMVSGIRFYKSALNTGTHTGTLWTTDGQVLATATFTNETATGWQSVQFSQPVAIQANTTYIVSYTDPNGHYAANSNGLWGLQPFEYDVTNAGPLHAVRATALNGNGVFQYGTTRFPNLTSSASNYWVDVLYTPQGAPGKPANVQASAGAASAIVTWNAPGGGIATSYKVTPYVNGVAQTDKAQTFTNSPLPTTATFTGLTIDTTYTFTVQASNPTGDGPVSDMSNPVAPVVSTVPSVPQSVTAAPASNAAQVSWQPPATAGGLNLTGYTVTPYIGSTAQTPVTVDPSTTTTTLTGLKNGAAYTFQVVATNAKGNSNPATTSVVTPEYTLFDFSTPASVDSGDTNSTVMGMKFTVDQYGKATGVRFYKAAKNIGVHQGALWTSTGTQLASVTFGNETATGWQEADFSTPVSLTPGTTYIVAYLAPKGHYSFSSQAFANAGLDNSPLHALATPTSANGVYSYSASNTFPTSTFNSTNYWVDVMFDAAPAPGPATGVTGTPGVGAVTLNWNAPTSGGQPTSYVVTPYVGATAQTPTTVSGTPAPTTVAIKGLTAGTTYTFTVRAVNPQGQSAESAPSAALTPVGSAPPTQPTNVSATAAGGSAQVSWSVPDSANGHPITSYRVTPYRNGAAQSPTTVDVSQTSAVVTGLTNGATYTFTVAATNSDGTGSESAASNSVVPGLTIFDYTQAPSPETTDKTSVTVGVKFTSDVSGSITGIRFYKAATNLGPHVGALWSATGTLLAQATFTNETATGWQEVDFATPVPIQANTTYVASYLAPKGRYSFTQNGFNNAIVRAPLRGLATTTATNGVYSYSTTSIFPTSTYKATNYWVDVLFTPGS